MTERHIYIYIYIYSCTHIYIYIYIYSYISLYRTTCNLQKCIELLNRFYSLLYSISLYLINIFDVVFSGRTLQSVPRQSQNILSRLKKKIFGQGKARKIIIAGVPASGKGTQCSLMTEKFGVVHLSTGDILRAAVKDGTELGVKAKGYMDTGQLVPDEIIIGVVEERIKLEDCQV